MRAARGHPGARRWRRSEAEIPDLKPRRSRIDTAGARTGCNTRRLALLESRGPDGLVADDTARQMFSVKTSPDTPASVHPPLASLPMCHSRPVRGISGAGGRAATCSSRPPCLLVPAAILSCCSRSDKSF